jgi:hypothetical protein
VSASTFDSLLEMIETDPVFSNASNVSQTPIIKQMAIAMFRFGHNGNAASVEAVAQWAGVSAGTIVNCTRRVMIAFLALHDSTIRWPSEDEKENSKQWVEAVSCYAWRDGYCMVDGTPIVLFQKPGFHGEAYFDRKSNYSLNLQVRLTTLFHVYLLLFGQLVTLPNLRIIDYVIGHCGSAHDSTVFHDSRTYRNSGILFNENEWMWADSAYALDRWCITPYKRPHAALPENKTFNYHLSRVC